MCAIRRNTWHSTCAPSGELRGIRRVRQLANYVAFDDARGTTRTKQQFHSMAGFPNVIGCIDCTHVKVIAPSRNEYEYVNRKGYHSINVQLICDADHKILNCVVKWPGSVRDAWTQQAIFRMHRSKITRPKRAFCRCSKSFRQINLSPSPTT